MPDAGAGCSVILLLSSKSLAEKSLCGSGRDDFVKCDLCVYTVHGFLYFTVRTVNSVNVRPYCITLYSVGSFL